MRSFIIGGFFYLFISFNAGAQCSNWIVENFDSFEYGTVCPFLIPGTVYHLSPQNSGFGPNHSGNTHLYLNFQNGFTGVALSRPYTVCIGNTYRISFYHRDAWGGANNTTFNFYDGNNVLLSSTNVPWTGTAWNQFFSPPLLATTTTLRLEVVNNQTTGNNDMVIDDMSIEVCGNSEQVEFLVCNQTIPVNLLSYFSNAMPTGGTWSGPSALTNGDLGTFDPLTNAVGVYTYAPLGQVCIQASTVTVSGVNPINLGNDTTLCVGSVITLNAGSGFTSYDWSTGASTQSIQVSQAGTYNVLAGVPMSNIVLNGDFEGGTTAGANNFTTNYAPGSGGAWGLLSSAGQYAITTSPNLVHNNFPVCSDHTTGSGNMLVANGASTANTVVWTQTLTVSANTDYLFSFWAMRVSNDPAGSDLQLFINGTAIGAINSTGSICNWGQVADTWNSGIATTAILSIVNQSTSASGNDFALDDISFSPMCMISDTIVISVEAPVQAVNFTNPTCNGIADGQITVDNPLAVEYSNNGGVVWQVDSFFVNIPSGNYTVCSRTQLGCTVCQNIVITNPAPVLVTASADVVICENGSTDLNATAIGGMTFLYHWDFTPNTNDTQTVSPLVNTVYHVYAENENGCLSALDSITVTINPPLSGTISLNATICPLDQITIIASASGGMGAPYTFTWSSGQINTVPATDALTTSPSITTLYTVTVTDGCETTPLVLNSTVTVAPLPVPQYIITSPAQCEPATFEIVNATDPNLSQFVTWTVNGEEVFVNQESIITGEWSAGYYDLNMVVTSYDGCVDSAYFQGALFSQPSPVANFTYSPSPATMFNTNVIFNNGSQGEEYYQWWFDQGVPSTSTSENPTSIFPDGQVGTYEVILVVESELGCFDTIIGEVIVYPEVILYAPNTFTPDGDEFNQEWNVFIEGVDIYQFELTVFNRWGEKIWFSQDPAQGWDATYRGIVVPSGTYIWTITAKDLLNDSKYEFNGHVNVLK